MERLTKRNEADTAYYYPNCFDECDGFGFSSKCDKCGFQDRVCDKLGEYEDLEDNGLLLRLPCKVGDTVYTACSWGIESGIVGSIEIISDRIYINNIHGEMIGESHNIFLTQEQAEQKLKEMNP